MNVANLRADWERATERDRPKDAIKALVGLEKLEPAEPRWSQRLGEAYRRTDEPAEAVLAFVRAFERYYKKGFVPQAVAMAKLVKTMDPARGDLMERSLPKGPPPLPEPLRRAVSAPKAPPPLPPRAVKPAKLAPAPDVKADEIRFVDAPDASIQISLEDLEISDVITLDVDDISLVPTPAPKPTKPAHDAYASMSSVRLFAVTSREALLALAGAADVVEFAPGATIIERDEPANALFAIVSGSAKVQAPGVPAIVLKEGDVFGEGSLIDEGRRQADVTADTQLMTLRIEKQALDTATKAHSEIDDVLFDLLARRLITNLLHASPLFTSFELDARIELAQRFEVRRADPGTVIAERGRKSDGLYVLLSGNVMAEPESGAPTRIARGTTFGHASLLGMGASDVTIRAATEAVLVRMPASGFTALASQYPPVLAFLAQTASEPLPASLRRP